MLAVRTPGAPQATRKLRDLRFRLPHCGTGSATPITIDFGAIFPFTLFRPTTSLSTLRSGRYRTPTQDSVRGCSLGFTAAAISGDRVQRTCTAQPAQIRTCPIRAYGLYGALFVKRASHHFLCFVTPFFCSTRAASILPPRPQISATVARSGGQGRRFFSAAEGLSLTGASTAAGYPRSGGRPRNDPRGACIGREQSREPRLYSVEPT